MDKVDTTPARLSALRALMKERHVDVYVIPSEDSHSSEYIAPCDTRREYISGFNGSAGCAIVTIDKAALSTDGRYFSQATKQLDANWVLLKQGLPGVPSWQDWAAEQSSGGRTVAVDPTLISGATAVALAEKIKRWGGAQLKALDTNLVDLVWGAARPSRPSLPVALQCQQFSGNDFKTKLADVRKILSKKRSLLLVVSALDDIAWLFNLRGADIPYNPVFFAYAIVTLDSATLFLDDIKLTAKCRDYLASNNVRVRPYDSIFEDTNRLRASLELERDVDSGPPKRFLLSNRASWALKLALGGDEAVESVRSPIGDLKTVKNAAELSGMRECHVRDGAALIEYFAWLEDQLIAKKVVLDEVVAADKLEALRKKQPYFAGLSFPTISSTGANAAVIHYQAQRGACSAIDPDAIYLCDAGAQYLDGTTDTTRTLHFGKPIAQEKRAYTLVLKGHIALDMAVFPKNTTGLELDCLARQYLRRDGLDYRHSTGHGVGSHLNVHEGPIGIGTRPEFGEVSLQAGNVVSIEPGYYEDGFFGIRIENVAIVRHVKTPNCFGGGPYLGFEHVTMVPLCRNLIEEELLSEEEKRWINKYHAKIYDCMKGQFEDDGLTLAWLTRETRPY